MTDEELRALVRDAIARHLGGAAGSAPSRHGVSGSPNAAQHASHGVFVLQSASDGACLIEPAVACTHCGYCKSYGH